MRDNPINLPEGNLFLNGYKTHENIMDYLEKKIYSKIDNPEKKRALNMFLREGDHYLEQTNLTKVCKDDFIRIFNFIKWLKKFLGIASEIMSQPNKEGQKKLSRLFNEVRYATDITVTHKEYFIDQAFSLLREAPWTTTLKSFFFTATKDQTQSYFDKISEELTDSAHLHLEKCIDLKCIQSTQSLALLLPFTEQLRQDCTFLSGKNLSDLIFRLLVLTKKFGIQSLDTSDQIQLYNNFQALINTKKNRTHKILENKRHKHTLALNTLDWHTTVMSLVQSNNVTAVSAAACLHQGAGAGSHENQTTQNSKKHTHKLNRGRTVAPTGSIQKRKISNKIKNKKAPETISHNSKALKFCLQLWQTKVSILQLTHNLLSNTIDQSDFRTKYAALMSTQTINNQLITKSRGNAPKPQEFQSCHEHTLQKHTFKKFIRLENHKLNQLKKASLKFYKNRTAKNKKVLKLLLDKICNPLPETARFFNDRQKILLQYLECLIQIESIEINQTNTPINSGVAYTTVNVTPAPTVSQQLRGVHDSSFWNSRPPKTRRECAFGAIGDGRPTSSLKQASPTSIAAIPTGW